MTHVLLESFENEEAEDWAAFGCHAIKTIYKLCEQPDQLCGNLLKAMVKKMMESGEEENENDKEVEGENTGKRRSFIFYFIFYCILVSDAIDVGEPLAQSTQGRKRKRFGLRFNPFTKILLVIVPLLLLLLLFFARL